MTSATTARVYRKELERHAEKTGFSKDIELGFLCHDFSMRGMAGLEASITSGMGHLTSFVGSETIPAIDAVEEYYNIDAEKELIAATVPATEHSVACACTMGIDVNEVILSDDDKIIGYIDSNGNKNML
jgi:nicotinamide phosphoribosyltransferase